MNIIYWINKIISSIVIVILIIAFIKFITAYSKESSSSLKEYINKKLDTIFYFFYILFFCLWNIKYDYQFNRTVYECIR